MNKFEEISELLLQEISSRFNNEPLDVNGIEWSDNLAEMLEKYLILHIRMWKLEDACGAAESAEEVYDLKRKIDYCFKDRRPKLTKAINSYLDNYVSNNKKFDDGNVKQYKNFTNKN